MAGSTLLVAANGTHHYAAGKTTLIDILAGRKRDAGKLLLCCSREKALHPGLSMLLTALPADCCGCAQSAVNRVSDPCNHLASTWHLRLSTLSCGLLGAGVRGRVSINGQTTAAHSRAAIVGYVLQDDLLHGSSTVQEYLRCRCLHCQCLGAAF